ncbi:MAG: hypothetical protein ACRBCL_00630 [Maritimibacter sp.]
MRKVVHDFTEPSRPAAWITRDPAAWITRDNEALFWIKGLCA